MSRTTQVITKKGVYESVNPGVRVRIDPELRDAGGNVLVPDHINPGTAFTVASINNNGTFDVQNLSINVQDCVWEATYNYSTQYNPLSTVQLDLGENGQDPSPEAAIPIGGGGGGDIRPNRITVGNALSGDTADTCDFLDPGDGTVLKTTIEAAGFRDDVFVKEGTYTITDSSLLPIEIPLAVKVHGAGVAHTRIVAGPEVTQRRIFNMGVLSTLEGMDVNHGAGAGVTDVGTEIINVASGSILRELFVLADFAPGQSLQSLISIAPQATNIRLLNVRLDLDANTDGGSIPGVLAPSLRASVIQIIGSTGNQGRAITNTGADDNDSNMIDISGDFETVGVLACDRSKINVAVTTNPPGDTAPFTLQNMQGSNLDISMRGSSATPGDNGIGLTVEETCQDNVIKGSILNYDSALSCAGQRNSFQCILEGENNISIFPEGAVGNKLVGCDIVNTGSPAVQVAGPRTIITGSRVDNGGGAVGVSLQATADNSNVTGNYINSIDQVADASAGSVEANNS